MRLARLFPVLCLFCALAAVSRAQTSSRKPPSRDNVKTGSIVAIDTTTSVLTLKPRTGPDLLYSYTDKTLILRDRKPADISAFRVGDTVVVRFRQNQAGPAPLYDLADKTSWEWIERLRRETTRVTVVEITEDTLRATEGPEKNVVDYRISEKTRWAKGGQSATSADFKPGDPIYVAPRLLPGGRIMAIAVSDTADTTARLKERTRRTVTGVVKAFDRAKRQIHLLTVAGDSRELSVAEECIVTQASKQLPLSAVRSGLTVTLHLQRDAEGEPSVVRITIQTRRTGKTPARPGPISSATKKEAKP